MAESLPILLVPGLLCSPRLYGPQLHKLWAFGPVMIADHRRDDSMEAVARRVLAAAPPRFALAGLSMGGYIAFAMLRQAPERIGRLALLDTSARPDTPEQTAGREKFMAMAGEGKFNEVVDQLTLRFLHVSRHNEEPLKRKVRLMAREVGIQAFLRQERAIMTRPDSRPLLGEVQCPTLVLVGDGDVLTPPDLAQEIAAGIKGSRLVTIPQCGHLSTIERPREVNAALAEWGKG